MLSIVSHDVIRIFATNIQDTTKVFTLTTDTDFSLQRLFCKALKFDQSVKTASGRFPLQKYKNCAQSGFPHFDAINIETPVAPIKNRNSRRILSPLSFYFFTVTDTVAAIWLPYDR